jgi:hypothetical protein
LSAQSNLSGLCRRLLAALSLIVAASLAASALPLAGRSGLQNAASADHSLLAGLRGLIEEENQLADAAAGDPRLEAATPAAGLIVAAEPPASARPPLRDAAVPRTHAARAGLTRAPPLA